VKLARCDIEELFRRKREAGSACFSLLWRNNREEFYFRAIFGQFVGNNIRYY
jgi:hypothetical protein